MIPFNVSARRDRRNESPFDDQAERRLIVVLDTDTVGPEISNTFLWGLLEALLNRDEVEVYRYADAGPPSSAKMLDLDFIDAAAIGWLAITPDSEPDALRTHGLTWSDGQHLKRAALGGDTVPALAMNIARLLGQEPVFQSTPDAILAAAASEIGADLLITQRQGLPRLRSPFAKGLTSSSLSESVPQIALYLRTRGHYIEAIGTGIELTAPKTIFFEHSAALFLPHALEVAVRCRMLATDVDKPEIQALAAAAWRRMSRSLQRRDEMWRFINQPQDIDVAEDMLIAVETMLSTLMGAVDATARLVHVVHGISGELYNVAWQKVKWSNALRVAAPHIWEKAFKEPSLMAGVTVLRLLRNTIHAEGLESISVRHDGGVVATWIGLPRAHDEDITQAAEQVAPLVSWGIRRADDGSLFADPAQLMERLVLSIFDFLADVHEVLIEDLRERTGEPDEPVTSAVEGCNIARPHKVMLGLPQTLRG